MQAFPPRRRPFLIVGGALILLIFLSVFFAASSASAGGLVAAAVFALVLVPVGRQGLGRGPGLVVGDDGLDARAAGVQVAWSEVTGVRHERLATPGTGGRGFLVLGLARADAPRRSGLLAPRARATDDGPELWIPLSGIDAQPRDVLEAATAARARARR